MKLFRFYVFGMYRRLSFLDFHLAFTNFNSINHEYKEWDEKNPNVPTCNANIKNMVQGSTVPQEVDKDKEVIFTYDVTFKVWFPYSKSLILLTGISHWF